jgi:hypothetical protein
VQKKWLFEEIIKNYGNFSGVILLSFNIFNHSEKPFLNEYWIFVMSLFLVLMALFIFIIFKIIPSKARAYLLETYPEYKLEKV